MKLRTKLALMIVTVTALPVLVTWLLGYVDVGTRSAPGRAEASAFLATQLWLRDEIVPAWGAVAAGADLELPAERTVLVVDVTGRILLLSWPGATRGDRLAERGLSFVPERLLSVAEPGQQASAAARGSLARRTVGHPVFADGRLVGAVYEVLLRPPAGFRFRWLLENGRWGLLTLVLLSALAVALLARSMRRSLAQLENATGRVAAGDLDSPLHANGRDEVAAVTRSFERMRLALQA